jgi:ABC-2 type transport system permease protein
MYIVWRIIVKEFHQLRRDPRIGGIVLIAPILQLIILGYAATTDVKDVPTVVCDLDGSSQSRDLVQRFTSSGYFTIDGVVHEHNAVDDWIDEGKAKIALVIPAHFGSNIVSGVTAPVQLIVDGSDGNTAAVGLGYASQIVASYAQSIIIERLERTPQPPRIGRIQPDVRIWYNAELKSKNYMIPGVIATLLLIITAMLTALVIVKERELGTLETLIVTPIRPWQLVLGKLIPFAIIGFMNVILVLTVGKILFDVPMRGSVLLLFGCGAVYLLTTLGLGLFLSTVSRTQQQAMMSMQFFVFIPFIYLSGFTFPIENMPVVIQYLTYIIPLRYFLICVRGIFLKGNTIVELWPQVGAMFAIGVFTLALSMKRFVKRLE